MTDPDHPEPRPLVVGVGNRLRGDDGVGAAVVEHLGGDERAAGARLLAVTQLTPELADDVAAASRAVIVDADATVAPGVVAVRPVVATGPGALGHHLTPASLVDLVETLEGAAPPVVVVAVGAAAFDEESLSPPVAAAVATAADVVAQLLDDDGHGGDRRDDEDEDDPDGRTRPAGPDR